MLGLEYFSFTELWSPVFLVLMMAIGILYTFVVGPWRSRFRGNTPVSMKRQISFLLAVVLLYLTMGGAAQSPWSPHVYVPYGQYGNILFYCSDDVDLRHSRLAVEMGV